VQLQKSAEAWLQHSKTALWSAQATLAQPAETKLPYGVRKHGLRNLLKHGFSTPQTLYG